MKTVVKLAVLFAILLLVNGMAFALTPCPPCSGSEYCYSVSETNLDTGFSSTDDWYICINGTSGYICVEGNQVADLSVFTQGLNLQMLLYPFDSAPQFVEEMTFHGHSANHGFTGIYFGTNRWIDHGYYVPCH